MSNNSNTSEPCVQYSFWNQENNKDDTGTAERVVFVLILVYILYLAKLVWNNIQDLLVIRKNVNIAKRMRVNILIGIFLLANVILYGDGLVGLFTPDGYLSLRWYYILQFTCLALMELCFLAAAYNWASPMSHLYNYNKDKVILVRKFYSFIVGSVIVVSITITDVIMTVSDQFCYVITFYNNGLQLWIGILLLAVWVNNMVFVVLCFLFANKITTFYEFKANKKAAWIKPLAYLTAFGLTFRIIKDGFQIFGIQLFSILILDGDSYGASNWVQLPWCIVEFLFLMLCGFVPITFLIIMSNVSNTQKATIAEQSKTKDIKLTLLNNSDTTGESTKNST